MPPTAPGSLISSAANYLSVAQALAQPSRVAVSGTAIDWSASAGGLYSKTLAANTTFTFTNVSVGEVIRIFIDRAALSGYTITWPGGITWTGGAAAAVDAPGYREIVLTCTGAGTYTGSHTSRANSAATSGVPGPAAPVSELIDSGSPATPSEPGRLIEDHFAAGTGAVIAGATDPEEANSTLLEVSGGHNGYPAYTTDGYFGSTSDPRYRIYRDGSTWKIDEQLTTDLLFSYYDSEGDHLTPFTVPEWNEEAGTGEVTVTAEGVQGPGELIDSGTPATPTAPGSIV